MNVRKISTSELIAALLFCVYTLLRLISGVDYSNFRAVVYVFSFVLIGVGLLTGIYLISAVLFAIDALIEVTWLFGDIQYGSYWFYIVGDITFIIAYIMLVVMMLPRITKSASADRNPLRALWFLPGVLVLAGYIPVFIDGAFYYFSSDGWLVFVWILMLIAALFVAGYAVTRPAAVKRPAASYAGYGQNAGQFTPNGQFTPSGQYGQTSQYAPTGQAPAAGAYKAPVSPVTPVTPVTPAAQAAPAAPAYTAPAAAAAAAASAAAKPVNTEAIELLRKYKDLLDAGVITQQEFDDQKKKILG